MQKSLLAALAVLAVFGTLVAFSVDSVADSVFSTGRETLSKSDHCDVVREAQSWWNSQLNKNERLYASHYHRNALRYDNGELFEGTNGLPISRDQLKCVTDRVIMRQVAQHVGRDKNHKYVGFQYFLYVEDHDPASVYTSLEFDRATCKISVERNYYDPGNAGIQHWAQSTFEECFGTSAAGVVSTFDPLSVVSGFLEGFVNEDLSMMQSYVANNAAFFINNVKWAGFMNQDFLDNLIWDVTTGATVNIQDAVKDNSGNVQVVYTYTYKIASKYDDSNKEYRTLFMGSFVFHDNGLIKQAMFTHGAMPEVASANTLRMPLPSNYEAFSFAGPTAEAPNVVAVLGKPTRWSVVPGGELLFDHPKPCWRYVALTDSNVPHTPRPNSQDLPFKYNFLYTALQVKIPHSKIADVLAVSPSISYNPEIEELVVLEDSYGANLVTSYLALAVVDGWTPAEAAGKITKYNNALYYTDKVTGKRQLNSDGSTRYTKTKANIESQMCALRNKHS